MNEAPFEKTDKATTCDEMCEDWNDICEMVLVQFALFFLWLFAAGSQFMA